MAQVTLDSALSHTVLECVSNFWFRHLGDDHVIVPSIEDATPWFSQNDQFDQECLEKFGAQLELIQSLQPSGEAILAAANPSTPLHWISLIILLDQLPRNCFRGAEARIAFTLFDKLAFEVASQALKLDLPKNRQVRFNLAHRLWFYMPLEHSESMETQESLTEAHDEMWHDYEMLLEKAVDGLDDDLAHIRAVLVKRKDSFQMFKNTMRDICESKKNTLRRFGRFPQRNHVLGRPSTIEELQWFSKRT